MNFLDLFWSRLKKSTLISLLIPVSLLINHQNLMRH